ncbi:hypothetical protein Taro_009655 [Colocasia esculenta]|uniref:Uncharacterized protein n=1 Tax=Colocasia esculenta TaxID=4460 RepID=A0A843U123_COLES|nr:hypothetical protein [Colocasia esculenta]
MGLQQCGPQEWCWLVSIVVGLRGSTVWAQSTHWFTARERDRAGRRVLNATAVGDVFWLPPVWVFVCMFAACRTLGGLADIDGGKATASYIAFLSQR